MGIWGVDIYDDDCACDIRDAFLNLMQEGKSYHEVATIIEEDFSDMFQDIEDGPVAKLALADQMYRVGAIEPERKKEIFKWIDNGGDISRWESAGKSAMLQRKHVLDRFCKEIQGNASAKGKSSRSNRWAFRWEPHQLFALPISDTIGASYNLRGEYLLLYVLGESTFFHGKHVPFVVAKVTENGVLPNSKESFDRLQYIIFAKSKYDPHFLMFRTADDCHLDENGFVHEYGFSITQFGGDVPPKELVLLGYLPDIQLPNDAFWRENSELGCQWSDLEIFLAKKYFTNYPQ